MKSKRLSKPSRAVFGMTLDGLKPDAWLIARTATVVTPWGDGTFHVGIDLHSPECDLFLDFLEAEKRVPLKFHLSIYEEADWKTPDAKWAGAILGWDDFVPLSLDNTFDPACPSPCYGFVPPHLPLRVQALPRSHAVGVKHHIVFSREMSGFLASIAPCDFGDVIIGDTIVRTHRRLFPRLSRKILPTELMTTITCAACAFPILALPGGATLGRRVDDMVLCRNEEGVEHMSAEHPIVVSPAVAREMLQRFPRGNYGLEPILDIESRCGQRIIHLIQRMRRLELSCRTD